MLLVLDCCHATLITRGVKQRGRFEVLAACAKGLETPLPGSESFTQALLTAMSEEVIRTGTTAHKLRVMIEQHAAQTPFWDSIGSNAVTSIPIRRLQPRSFPGFMRKPTGYLFFRASLVDDLDGLKISDWLKTNAPPNVTAVNIEAIVLKARRLQKTIDHNVFTQNSIFKKFPESTQAEVLRELQALDTVMANSRRYAQDSKTLSNKETISDTLDAIEASTKAINTSIETPILLDLPEQDVNQALREEEPLLALAMESVSLRKQILSEEHGRITSFLIPRTSIQYPRNSSRFRFATIRDQDDIAANVILEFFNYEPDPQTDGPYPESLHQVERIAARLCHSKPLSFHILPCLGYIHDELNHQFGLAFQRPPNVQLHGGSGKPVSLLSLYDSHPRVPLGQRIQLAYALATALENFHRVGWIHKGIRPDNILFFPTPPQQFTDSNNEENYNNNPNSNQSSAPPPPPTTPPEIPFSSPWLFGFEYARAGAAGTQMAEDHSLYRNLYRHPDRWSQPKVPYTRAHDIFSLGIVLLEIAWWMPVQQIAGLKLDDGGDHHQEVIRPGKVLRTIVRRMEREVPHRVGEVWVGVVRRCLGVGEVVGGWGEGEVQRWVQREVVGPLGRLVGRM